MTASKVRRWVLAAAASAIAIGCFGTTVTELLGYPEWGDDNSSGRDVIRISNVPFVLSKSYGRFAMARFRAVDGLLFPGSAPDNDWGYGLEDEEDPPYDPADGPLGWVAWSPPTGGSSFTPTAMAYDPTGNQFFVTGSAVAPGSIRAAFSAVDQQSGAVALNTWFHISSSYNSISGSADAQGGDIIVSGSEAYVFGQVKPQDPANRVLWVANLDLQGNLDHAFGDACIGNPSPCLGSTGFITLDTGFAGLAFADALIDNGTAYAVAQGDGGAIVVGEFNLQAGSGSSVWTTDGTAADAYAPEAIALQADGKVLIAGSEGNDAIVIRYNSDGTRDSSFGTGGKVTFSVAGHAEAAFKDVVVLSNGLILVAGYTKATVGGSQEALSARFESNGNLDTTYSPSGYQITTIAGVDNTEFNAISNGNPVATGSAGGKILLTRLVPVAP